jgi:hypothetical protein
MGRMLEHIDRIELKIKIKLEESIEKNEQS